jgi:hypothetical protein
MGYGSFTGDAKLLVDGLLDGTALRPVNVDGSLRFLLCPHPDDDRQALFYGIARHVELWDETNIVDGWICGCGRVYADDTMRWRPQHGRGRS